MNYKHNVPSVITLQEVHQQRETCIKMCCQNNGYTTKQQPNQWLYKTTKTMVKTI